MKERCDCIAFFMGGTTKAQRTQRNTKKNSQARVIETRMERIRRMNADGKSKKVKVKKEMHPNLLNYLNLLNIPSLCGELNHKDTKENTRITKALALLVGEKAN